MKITRTFDLLGQYKGKYAYKTDSLVAKKNGEWIKFSSIDYVNNANKLSYGLLALGMKKTDRIASITNNRPEWNFLDMALSQSGMIHVPIYPTISENDYTYIFKHAQPKLIFISDKILYNKLTPVIQKVDPDIETYSFNEIDDVKNWKEIYDLGEKNEGKYKKELEKLKSEIKPDEMVTLIYTSGTTGNPKGVMLSHNNIVSNLTAFSTIVSFNDSHRTLSFLPICHIFERTVNYYFQYIGVSIYYAENLGTIADNIKEVKPHVFISVPRLIEKVYDKIIAKGNDLSFPLKSIFFWAVKLGLKYDYVKKGSLLYRLKLKIANILVFKKWRAALGGNLDLVVVGGAALQPRLSRIFGAAGIPLVEGYGLTETSPVIAANNLNKGEVRVGTVGPVLLGVEVKIAEDGEILARGPNIMIGYYKEPGLTKLAIEKDGWFHTGDIGELIDGKYLKITDRKKEIFKLSSGKYIAPQVIENKFKESIFIEQVMIIGENEKFASALISPNFQFLHNWCHDQHIDFLNNKELIKDPKVVGQYQKIVAEINKTLGQTELVKRFRLVEEEWSPQSGELSPTLKLKRQFIFHKYKDVIKEIYDLKKNGDDSF